MFFICRKIYGKKTRQSTQFWILNDPKISKLMRLIVAMAFVPVDFVPQTFYDLETEICNNWNRNVIDGIVDYVDDNYIGEVRVKRKTRCNPI